MKSLRIFTQVHSEKLLWLCWKERFSFSNSFICCITTELIILNRLWTINHEKWYDQTINGTFQKCDWTFSCLYFYFTFQWFPTERNDSWVDFFLFLFMWQYTQKQWGSKEENKELAPNQNFPYPTTKTREIFVQKIDFICLIDWHKEKGKKFLSKKIVQLIKFWFYIAVEVNKSLFTSFFKQFSTLGSHFCQWHADKGTKDFKS